MEELNPPDAYQYTLALVMSIVIFSTLIVKTKSYVLASAVNISITLST